MSWPGMRYGRDLAELVRAPAALTVPGDSLAGGAAAGWPFGAATPVLAGAATCLYWAGMALNDWADRDLDAVERPERPIPSGRVSPGLALVVATGLTAAGLGGAALAGGRRAVAVAVPLAGAVWAYDLALKSTPAGPAVMAAARGLDVLLGAGAGNLRRAGPAALAVAAHTLSVTVLSRGEVHGGSPRTARRALAVTAGVTGFAARALRRRGGTGRAGRHRAARAAGAALFATYAWTVGRAQAGVARDPRPEQVRRAVGAGIHGMIPLQAGLAAATGRAGVALPVAAVFPLARRLARKVSPT